LNTTTGLQAIGRLAAGVAAILVLVAFGERNHGGGRQSEASLRGCLAAGTSTILMLVGFEVLAGCRRGTAEPMALFQPEE